MSPLSRLVTVALWATLFVNEASGTETGMTMKTEMTMRVASKQEIMARMTPESAVRTVLGMNRTRERPELVALIQTKFRHMLKRARRARMPQASQQQLQTEHEDGQTDDDDKEEEQEEEAEGTSASEGQRTRVSPLQASVAQLQTALRGGKSNKDAVDKATEMLNTMAEETQGNLEAEEFRCSQFDGKTTRSMESMRGAVSSFNGQAAEARGLVVKAQGEIGSLKVTTRQTQEDFIRHKADCNSDILALNAQLKVVMADIEVMKTVLEMTKCKATVLVQCAQCAGAVMMQSDDPRQQALSSLQSDVGQEYLQNKLALSYDEAKEDGGEEPYSLLQTEAEHLRRHIVRHRKHHSRHALSESSETTPIDGTNTSEVPTAPQPMDCHPNTKCSLSSNPNCQKLQDRFLVVQAGIVDKRDDLQAEIREKQEYCEEQDLAYKNQLDGMQAKLREEQTNLAGGTEEQNQAEAGSHLKSTQHEETATEYTRTMKECCDNQNTAKSELCALGKIRGELLKIEGVPGAPYQSIVDCDVADWREEECSATCGGGVLRKTRSVIVQPEGKGRKCPPLTAEVPCNTDECPVDCKVADWGGWSSCSAGCGGGVKERSRGITVDPSNGGDPCEETEEEIACNMGSCDADCELSEWNEWSTCSKPCDGGSQRRMRDVVTPAHGSGQCWEPEDEVRLEFKGCNPFECSTILQGKDRSILKCDSKVDIIVMLDGSGSLGSYGWAKSKIIAKNLISNLKGGEDNVNVALQLFSGPRTWSDYYACTGDSSATNVNMKTQCGIEWISHFTTNTASVAALVDGMSWPRASTLTSVALGQAEAEVSKGREDANTVVICITDGIPMSQYNTRQAARKLQKSARVLWVPVGRNAPLKLIHELASLPKTDNVIKVRSWYSLTRPRVANKIIASTCPIVE